MKKAIRNIIYVIIFLLSTSIVIMIGQTIGSSNSSSSSSASSSSSLSSYVIQGKIIDEAGKPLNKISIQTSRVNDNYRQSVLTNCDGAFVFDGLSSGLYTFILFLNDDSYSLVNEIENINLSGNQNIFNLQDIVLKKEVKPSWGPLH